MDENWQADLERWLAPFVAALGHKTRARMCPVHIAGLIGPGDRKSVQPMAARWRSRLRSASLFRRDLHPDDVLAVTCSFANIPEPKVPK